ncbi:hypothetical protein [Parasphingopyxis marina]|uniref:Uncharacterized protein n=1 Tax=Parasphingopyxis marina TaxID=2761622 RepID=A0A842HRL9_9SPHN|nr:hypothetical protein [Parasphingopyxis marina]MBC2776448.1 hypothetical protein [Parasphingopyxis marina]
MDDYYAIALGALVAIGGFLALFVFLGLRGNRPDLLGPPADFGKREFGKKPVVRPAPVARTPLPRPAPPKPQPAIAASTRPIAAEPEAFDPAPADPAPSNPAPGPAPTPERAEFDRVWRREGSAGRAQMSESDYTPEQYVEREVKALLLQGQRARALRHVMFALSMPADQADAYVDRLASATRF